LISFAKKYDGADEYSIAGWTYFDEPADGGKDEHSVYLFTSNNPTVGKFKNGEAFGDFTLALSITRTDLKFCSYTYGGNGKI
jgi:hypothetical protein